ncbi:MAG TPA: extracellular solute-binding protein [Aggregatilineales bacterium]|nr:extracellular solute-binding protein [Aggregatilineales bacterium]
MKLAIALLAVAVVSQTDHLPGIARRADGIATGTPEPARPILIWWPAPIYPVPKSPALVALTDQINQFMAERHGSVEIRVKRPDGLGGIYQSLRSGVTVAPSVMPDLILVQRDDLVQAAAGGLIQPVHDLPRPNLFSHALGTAGDATFGIPYTLEITHLVYRAGQFSPLKTLNDLQAANAVLLFPGSAQNNTLLLCQYVAAGGHVTGDKGSPVLDTAPLQTVLAYYEEAVKDKRLGPSLLDYTSLSQYWPIFLNDKSAIAQISSTTYLNERANVPDMDVMPIPTLDGSTVTTLDGWMWAVVATDPVRQNAALDLVSWLMDADRHGNLTRQLGNLPSDSDALARWTGDSYATFAQSLLDGQIAPFPDTIPPAVATTLQKAFDDVIMGRKSAQAAASDAVGSIQTGSG